MCSDSNMELVTIVRMSKGKQIAQKPDQIQQLDELTYLVKSQSGNGSYQVHFSTLDGWTCKCPDFVYRQVKCKHIFAVEFSRKLRDKVRENIVIQPLAINACLYCKSENIKKDGLRHNQCGTIQIWNCKACGRYFTVNIGFERMRQNPQAVTTAMQLYC